MKRDSRFELLRIISMFFIILAHFEGWGQGWRLDLNGQFLNGVFASSYLALGKLGAFLFVMITGYFIGNRRIGIISSIRKSLLIWCYTFYYTFTIFIILLMFKIVPFSYSFVFQSVFPLTSDHYWFVTAYIMLIIFTPFINNILVNISKRGLIYLILVITVFGNVLPQIGNISFTVNSSLGYIIPSYLVGAYLSKYGLRIGPPYLDALIIYLLVTIFSGLSYKMSYTRMANFFTDGIFQLIIALLIFTGILKKEAYHNKIINAIASTVFSAYLITEDHFVRPIIWNIFSFRNVKNLLEVNLLGIASVILIIITVFFIDQIRKFIFKKIKIKSLIAKLTIIIEEKLKLRGKMI